MPATAEKSTEKTTKSAAKSSTKVFDISKPNKQPASATSRPVIVQSRPIMQDPMMSTGTMNVKIVDDKPADEKPDDEATLPEVSPSKVKMTVQPLSESDSDSDKEMTEDQPATTDEKPDETDGAEPAKPAEDKPAADDIPIQDPTDSTKDEKAAAELEAAAKKQAELDALVEAKEYFLPINAVERRRSKLVQLLGVVLIIGLGLLLVDLMLDAGFISIPGVSPITHIFSV